MSLAAIAVVGTVVSVAAAGIGAYVQYQGQQQQAKNATAIANYNARVQQQNADYQSKLAVRQAQINASFNQTQQNQVVGIDQQAAAIRAQAQEDVRRNEERQRRMIATQRAGYAKAGVLMEGSPLAVLADTAGIFELQNQDTQYEAETKAMALEREAALRRAGLAADASVLSLNAAAARYAGRVGRDEAQITRMQGAAQAQGYRTAAYGSLLSGVGSAASGIGGLASSYSSRPRAAYSYS